MRKISIFIFLLFVVSQAVYAGDSIEEAAAKALERVDNKMRENSEEIAKATDFSVPSSPAFTLLGVTPSEVAKPGFMRDFKLDWLLKDGQLASDIAIEAQVFWLLFFRNISAEEYQKPGAPHTLLRRLSTLNASLGTTEKDDVRSLAFSLKLNLYAGSDPLNDTDYMSKIKSMISFSEEEKGIIINGMLPFIGNILDAKTPEDKKKHEAELANHEAKLSAIDEKDKAILKSHYQDYLRDHWNSTMVDIGYGRIYNYKDAALDRLDFEDKGYGLWLNASLGRKLGKYKLPLMTDALLSGIVKYTDLGGDPDSEQSMLAGANLRYGGSRTNFFIEYIFERTETNGEETDTHTIAYGGEYRLGQNRRIEFGLRTEYDDEFTLSALRPVISLNWGLGEVIF